LELSTSSTYRLRRISKRNVSGQTSTTAQILRNQNDLRLRSVGFEACGIAMMMNGYLAVGQGLTFRVLGASWAIYIGK
jgi:hypothetical protein